MQKLACITGLLACVPGLFGRLAPCVPGLFGRLDSLVSQGSLDVSIAPPVSQGSWDVSIPETSIEPHEISPNEPCVISPARARAVASDVNIALVCSSTQYCLVSMKTKILSQMSH
mmetsp:Transcript_30522/g.44615  ORF Transcript_30522/g.44615 Transcript_30522/m.44615 type:complete len:115 (+) Transcript_30522:957-1301(+)